ncbi:E3 ubiquitin-protein ligase TRIM39-like [Amblyraja radiata]|uniref:E3 ubiquitin-protein ligase TRIM39-like n=1 Tax=Amblyraja radiata TaxID=386614 RepID=UPI001402F611|nr:E3 ubiquitin-protein ligase TRIM39-like [Amblyraja radiata]
MKKNLQEIQENLNSIEEELSQLQEQIDHKDGVTFLKDEAGRESSASVDTESLSVTDAAPAFETIYRPFVLNTMITEISDAIKRCSFSPYVSVTLDVETASPWLEESEDRKRVRITETERSLPDTGKRFTDVACMLGSEGFTSGRHYWEVEVAGNRDWCLGAAAESVERKRGVTLTPETGVWSIWREADEFVAFTSPKSRLPARTIPAMVGVYLSYESGTVSFYDADTKSHLYTFTGIKFTGKLYPFFATYNDQWLSICSGYAPGV